MNDKSTIVTVAMLSSFLNKKNVNYLDLLIPYLEIVLPTNINEIIDEDKIQTKMKTRFSISLPLNVIKELLKRYRSKGNIVRVKINGQEKFRMSKIPDTEGFHRNYNNIDNNIQMIITSLEAFFVGKAFRKMSKDELLNLFLEFLNYYGISVISDTLVLNGITDKNERKGFAIIGRFIIDKYKNEPELFNKIIEIVKGFFVYKSIYYYYSNAKTDTVSKLKKTMVFLDARELINALKLNTPEDSNAMWELINLIHESEGEIAVFTHTIEEVYGILTSYAKNTDSRLTMMLEYFDINYYTCNHVLRYRDNLESKIKGTNIHIMETPILDTNSHDISNLEDIGFFNKDDFKAALINEYSKYRTPPKDLNLERDVLSIYGVSMLRGRARKCKIENCKAILASTNPYLSNVVKSYFYKRMDSEINFVIHDVDLTALLWLRDFNTKSEAPKHILLKNAYAALNPDADVMNSFLDNISVLEKEGVISIEEALAVRTDPTIKEIIGRSSNEINKSESVEIVRTYFKEKFSEKDEQYHNVSTKLKITEDELEMQMRKNKKAEEKNNEEDLKKIEARISLLYLKWINFVRFIPKILAVLLLILFLSASFVVSTSNKYSDNSSMNAVLTIFVFCMTLFNIAYFAKYKEIMKLIDYKFNEYCRQKVYVQEEKITKLGKE